MTPEQMDALVRELHMKLPMATQEDAIEFARRYRKALAENMEPAAYMDNECYELVDKDSKFDVDIPLYSLEDWKK